MLTLDDIGRMIAELRGQQIRNTNVDGVRAQLLRLLESHVVIVVRYDFSNMFVRSRVCRGGTGYSSLVDLIYPPTPPDTYGRANVPGRQVLYASLNKGTSMDEIEVSAGNLVQTIVCRPRPGRIIELAVVGEIQSVAANGRTRICPPSLVDRVSEWMNSDRAKFHAHLHVDAFLAEVFSARSTKLSDYAISATFADIVYEHNNMGVLFPSMRRELGWNLALPKRLFDENCEVLVVNEDKIDKVYGYGIYDPDMQRFRLCNQFDPDGRIAWEKPQRPFTVSWNLSGGLRFPDDFVGWHPNAS